MKPPPSGQGRNRSPAAPHRQSWAKVDDDTRAELARILRTKGQARTADALRVGIATLLDVLSGGTVRQATVERVTAAVRAYGAKAVA